MKNRSFSERVVFALNGLGVAWQRETSFRVQAVLAACAVVVLVVLRPPWVWWAIVAISIALVLAIELVNSAFEALVDHLHPDVHPKVRIIKDMAAGSVLLSAAGAVVVGLLLLVSYYWD
jgi:undecaprenol kinase